jgi:Flp pilus assembly pilin Flp
MSKGLRKLLRKARVRSGQSLTEYALILSFVAMIAVLILRGVGIATNNKMAPVPNALQ